MLPPTLLSASDLPDRVAVLLVDTSSRIEDRGTLQARRHSPECCCCFLTPIIAVPMAARGRTPPHHATKAASEIPRSWSPSSAILPPNTAFAASLSQDLVPIRLLQRQAEVARAESIILTYSVDSPASIIALRDEWLPELRRFGVRVREHPTMRDIHTASAILAALPFLVRGENAETSFSPPAIASTSDQVPIIVVGCKLDRLDGPASMSADGSSGSARTLSEEHLESLLEYRDVERCLVCSARTLVQARQARTKLRCH